MNWISKIFGSETLEKRAKKQLGEIDAFVGKLVLARNSAEEINGEAQDQIDSAKTVQKTCQTVANFVDKVTNI